MFERIKQLREDSDLTQKEMGAILSCSQRLYSDYERGKVNIPPTALRKLADYFDVSIDYLLERTDNRKINK